MSDKKLEIKLFKAAHNGNLDKVKRLVEIDRVDVNSTIFGRTALIWASSNGHLNVVEFLVEKGAEININDEEGQTALIWASEEGHLNVVEFLIEKGAEINIKDEEGETALIWASYNGHLNVAEFLVEKGAEINMKDKLGQTALFWASLNGHLNVAEFLVEKGAQINFKENLLDIQTALFNASENGHPKLVKALYKALVTNKNVKRGLFAQVNDLFKKEKQLDVKNKSGFTPLMLASQNGHVEVITVLLELGATVNVKNNGNTALDLAVDESTKYYLLKAVVQQRVGKGQYEKIKTLGQGNFAKVYLYQDKHGNKVAVKRMNKISESYHIKQELKTIDKLGHHNNVIAIYYHNTLQDRIHIYMEVCDGTLTKYINENRLEFNVKINLLAQVANGMNFIHENRIIHRDLKPDNILIKDNDSEEVVAKITDFGLAYPLDDDERTMSLSLSFGGSQPYMAPEMLRTRLSRDAKIPRTYKIDIWSFGVVAYKVIKGQHPFQHIEDTLDFNAEVKIPEDFKDNPSEFISLLIRIFNQDPEERPSMETIYDVLNKLK